MRLWSIHPKYLDRQGLICLWRETLLAQKVLQGKTKGYKNHPQLIRFKNHPQPIKLIGLYLHTIFLEAKCRDYNFDINKIDDLGLVSQYNPISITDGQLSYEWNHFLNKVKIRSPIIYNNLKNIDISTIVPNQTFIKISGNVEEWEKRR